MKHALASLAVIALLLGGACRNHSMTTAHMQPTRVANANPSKTPEQLGVIGAQIKANPNDAARILGQHGLTEAQFEQAIRKVTESPEASKQYAAAFHKAGGR